MRHQLKLGRTLLTAAAAIALLGGCGQRQEPVADVKILGGTDVPADQDDVRAKATVALTTELNRGTDTSPLASGHSFCTGTVIAERIVITAAHCLQQFDPETRQKLDDLVLPEERDFLVFFGNKVTSEGKWIRAEKVIPHPDWSPANTLSPQPSAAPNDVGMVVLSEPIPEGAAVAPIAPLAMELEGSQAHLVGFGVTMSRNNNDTGTKRQVTVPLNSLDAGSQRFSVGAMLRGACAGDSGGPAYVEKDGEYYVIGATSTGAELFGICIGLVNNYTDIRYYADWVETTAGDLL